MNTPKTQYHWFCLTSSVALVQLMFTVNSHAAIFTVMTTADSGAGSLRQAITDANAFAGTDTIAFNISDTGPHTIQPLSALPVITEPVVIDGYTQSGAQPNTLEHGDNAKLMIVLDGSQAGDDPLGFTPVYGLEIDCGSTTVRGLVVANFADSGIYLWDKGGNVIQGNFIGTDWTGVNAQGNGFRSYWRGHAAVLMAVSSDNLIGGTTPGARNLISGNLFGVRIDPGDRNLIQGNFIGTDASGMQAVPNLEAGIYIYGTQAGQESIGNVVGGGAPGAGNLISGNRKSNPTWPTDIGYGIMAQDRGGTVIQGNRIGTDVTGKVKLGNQLGVLVSEWDLPSGTSGALIGGTGPGEGNLISGNDYIGLQLGGTASKVVQGNLIGTDVSGSEALGNGKDGISLIYGTGCLIGGTMPEARNVVSCNGSYGIEVLYSDHNFVQGNFIGTDITGTKALPNSEGIALMSSANNLVGGVTPGARNVISGNGNIGVDIRGSGNKLQGNFIGTDFSGTEALGNFNYGIILYGPAKDNEVGGVELGAGNLISGQDSGYAIYMNGLDVTGTRVKGNLIGTDVTGVHPLGNTVGVAINGANDSVIGGSESGAANVIAHSSYYGVVVYMEQGPGVRNAIRGNSIFDNNRLLVSWMLGLDLGGDGVTPNDPLDADAGPNNLQNYPTITSASTSSGGVQIQGTLDSTPNTTFTLDFYANAAADLSGHGEGETYLGAVTVATDASGSVSFKANLPKMVPTGQIITATATDPEGNTSEFSGQSPPVTYAAFSFVGFLPPIGGADATGGSFDHPVRTFKNGSTIPVKFTISSDGAPVLTGIHRLQAIKYSDATTAATPIDATPQDAATTGNQFRLTDSQWHFNLDTKAAGMTAGIWQLVATLSDGSQHYVWIQIK
jgi:hypothetical protein